MLASSGKFCALITSLTDVTASELEDIVFIEKAPFSTELMFLVEFFDPSGTFLGEESYRLEICNPLYIQEACTDGQIVVGYSRIIIPKLDPTDFKRRLAAYVSSCVADTLEEVSERIGRIAKSENSDMNLGMDLLISI